MRRARGKCDRIEIISELFAVQKCRRYPRPFFAAREAAIDPELTSAVQLFCGAKSLLDHLVGTQQDRLRHRQTERLGGLEVYGHLEFRRKQHREIARLRAAQNAIDVTGGTTIGV